LHTPYDLLSCSMPFPKGIKLPKALQDYYAKQGAEGGRTRAKNMTPEQRSAAARKAVAARWAKMDASLKEMDKNLKKLVRNDKARKSGPAKRAK
jgi:hypothetical protein